MVETLIRDFKGKGIRFDQRIDGVSDLLIILCGCQKGCVDKPEWRARGRESVAVKGRAIDFVPMTEEEILGFLRKRIEKGLSRLDPAEEPDDPSSLL